MPFNQEAADEICGKIAEGQSLRRIMRDDTEGRLPGMTTIWKWLRENETFARQYAQAREEQAEAFADEIAAIADETPELEPVRGPDGEIVEMKMHAAYVQHQKNRIDARKWVASKLKPKKYGDKLGLTDGDGGPLQVVINRLSDTDG